MYLELLRWDTRGRRTGRRALGGGVIKDVSGYPQGTHPRVNKDTVTTTNRSVSPE